MVRRYALIQRASKLVRNVVLWDGDLERWMPPEDCDAIASDEASPEDTYDDQTATFTRATTAPDQLGPDIQRLRDYVISSAPGDVADQLDQYLALASPTAAQNAAALKATIRALRSLIRVTYRLASAP